MAINGVPVIRAVNTSDVKDILATTDEWIIVRTLAQTLARASKLLEMTVVAAQSTFVKENRVLHAAAVRVRKKGV